MQWKNVILVHGVIASKCSGSPNFSVQVHVLYHHGLT
jgi:hypothetical protein